MLERSFVVPLLAAVLCLSARRSASSDFAAECEGRVRAASVTYEESSFEAHLGRGTSVTVTANATTKGNGGITIENLCIRSLDRHDDGFVYEGETLTLTLRPATLIRDAEIVATGIGVVTGEKEGRPVIARVPLSARFRFDSRSRRFVIEEMRSPISFAWLTSE